MMLYILIGIGILLLSYACYTVGYSNGVKDILEYMDRIVRNLDDIKDAGAIDTREVIKKNTEEGNHE